MSNEKNKAASLIEVIRNISERKTAKRIEPAFATLMEIKNELDVFDLKETQRELRRLIKAGEITYGQTLNDYYFKIKKK